MLDIFKNTTCSLIVVRMMTYASLCIRVSHSIWINGRDGLISPFLGGLDEKLEQFGIKTTKTWKIIFLSNPFLVSIQIIIYKCFSTFFSSSCFSHIVSFCYGRVYQIGILQSLGLHLAGLTN